MEAAFELKSAKSYNMIILGALLKVNPIVSVDSVMTGLKKTLPERHHDLLPANREAIVRGMELIK